MKRRQARFQHVDPDDVNISMKEWGDVLGIMKFEIARGFKLRCPAFKAARKSKAVFLDWARNTVTPRVLSDVGDSVRIRRILWSQMEWRAANRPSPGTRHYDGDNRGRDKQAQKAANLVGAVLPADRKAQGDKRQELAGTLTRAGQRDATVEAIVEVLTKAFGDTLPDDRAAIIRTVIASEVRAPSTVYARIDAAVLQFRDASRYIARAASSESIPVTQSTDVPVTKQAIRPKQVRITTKTPTHAIVTPVVSQHGGSGQPRPTPVDSQNPASAPPDRRESAPPRRLFRDVGLDFIDEAIELMRPEYADGATRSTRLPDHPTVQ
jgi:hypothetical protein